MAGQIGAEQITALAPAHLAQLVAIEPIGEGRRIPGHHDVDETPG